MKRLILFVLGALFLVVWLVALRPTYLGGKAGYVLVDGTSMQPALYTGDLVITHKQTSYDVGDTVAYLAEGSIVIHRIIDGDAASGFILQGDNRQAPDVWRPKPEHVIGRQWLRLPGVGQVIEAIRTPEVFLVAFSLLLTWLAASFVPRKSRISGPRSRYTGLILIGIPESSAAEPTILPTEARP